MVVVAKHQGAALVRVGILNLDLPRSSREQVSKHGGCPMKIETSIVTTKGQLVIPARLRRRFGIKKGTRVTFVEDAGRIIVQPMNLI